MLRAVRPWAEAETENRGADGNPRAVATPELSMARSQAADVLCIVCTYVHTYLERLIAGNTAPAMS